MLNLDDDTVAVTQNFASPVNELAIFRELERSFGLPLAAQWQGAARLRYSAVLGVDGRGLADGPGASAWIRMKQN